MPFWHQLWSLVSCLWPSLVGPQFPQPFLWVSVLLQAVPWLGSHILPKSWLHSVASPAMAEGHWHEELAKRQWCLLRCSLLNGCRQGQSLGRHCLHLGHGCGFHHLGHMSIHGFHFLKQLVLGAHSGFS